MFVCFHQAVLYAEATLPTDTLLKQQIAAEMQEKVIRREEAKFLDNLKASKNL